MIDLTLRVALLALFVAVLIRSIRQLQWVKHPSRRRSLGVMAIGVVAPMVFWVEVALSAPITTGGLLFSAWLSRIAFLSLAVTMLVLQSFIRDAEHHEQ